jgi:hypothetical protein
MRAGCAPYFAHLLKSGFGEMSSSPAPRLKWRFRQVVKTG